MAERSFMIKTSGDLCRHPGFICMMEALHKDRREKTITISVGGGKQINQAFRERGWPIEKHGPLGRELKSLEERQVAVEVLERNKKDLEKLLARRKIVATVIIPELRIGEKQCYLNGDTLVLATYLEYDELWVVTTHKRISAKQKMFGHLPKVKIMGLPSN